MSGKNKTILLVEDEVILAMTQKMALEKYGYNVIIVNSGEKAVEIINNTPGIQLILMDIDLGKGIDGTEAAEIILKDYDIPVIFCSNHTEPEIVEKTEKITSYGYVVKSSSNTVLDASIKMAFKLFEANRKIGDSELIQKALISNISDVIGIIGVDGIMKYKSPNIEKWFGWKPEDLIGTDGWLTVHPDDLKRIQKEFFILLENDTSSTMVEYRYKCKDGRYKPIELTATNLISNPLINGVLLNYHDISKRMQAEDALRVSEEKYRTLVDNLPTGVVLHGADSAILFSNAMAESILGLTADQMRGKTAMDPSWFFLQEDGSAMPYTEYPVNRVLASGNGFQNLIIGRPDPDRTDFVWAMCNAYPVYGEDSKITQVVVTFNDITKRKLAEKEIKTKNEELEALNQELKAANEEMEAASEDLIATSEDLLTKEKVLLSEKIFTETFFECIPGYLFVYDEQGNLIRWNKKHETMTGYSAEELSHMNMSNWFEGEDAVRVAAAVEEVFKTGFGEVEANILIKGGGKLLIHSNGVRLTIDGKTYFTGIGIDITKKKADEEVLRESLERFNLAIENTGAGVWDWDMINDKVVYSTRWKSMLGYADHEVENSFSGWKNLWHPDDSIRIGKALDDYLNGKTNQYEIIHRCRHKDGEWRWIQTRGDIIKDAKGQSVRWVGTNIDITERKLAEDKIKSLLAEKELILKEVHHRIKNNMNSMKGLLLLQATTMDESAATTALEDASKRMQSMEILYDQLYQSASFTELSIKSYLSPLIDAVIFNFPEVNLIKVEKHIDDFILDAKRLQPLGIIINELLTNIMKYAFRDKSKGIITFTATLVESHIILSVQDNGKGIPTSINFTNSTGFGLMLVNALAGQLDGKIRIERVVGTRIVLEFEK